MRPVEVLKRQSITDKMVVNFLSKIEMGKNYDSCWLWKGAVTSSGYGSFNISYKKSYRKEYAHRVSYVLYVGEIPIEKYVLHKCDNRLCVNPTHLFLGSQRNNYDDMVQKRRGRNFRILNDCETYEALEMFSEGHSVDYIADRIGTDKNAIISLLHKFTLADI